MKWVIERNLFFANDQMRFVEALKQRGSKHQLVDFVPFAHEIVPEPSALEIHLVAMGSTNFIRTVLMRRSNWRPGAWHNADFCTDAWIRHLGARFLNYDGETQPFGKLHFEGVRFVRPCADLKAFTGTLVHIHKLLEFQNQARLYDVMADENALTEDTPVLVALPKEIVGEFRFFVVNRQVVSGCRYKPYWTADPHPQFKDAQDFAQDVALDWGPADAYVLDVARLPNDDQFVIEYNCLNAAGLYECPVDPIIEAVESLVDSRPVA